MTPIGATISIWAFRLGQAADRQRDQAAFVLVYSVKTVCSVAAS